MEPAIEPVALANIRWRIVAGELGRLGWTEADGVNQPKRGADTLALAARLRRGTTMPLKWHAVGVDCAAGGFGEIQACQ